jgi:hypothetical protein
LVSNKRRVVFYADEKIEQWYESLPESQRGQVIADILNAYIDTTKPGKSQDLGSRLRDLEARVTKLEKR